MRELVTVLTALTLTLTGCVGQDPSDSEDNQGLLPLTWALAVDPGCPIDVKDLEVALGDGLARWEEAPSPLSMHYQGAGDTATISNDGLQVVWIWWGSTPWEGDESALVQQWTYGSASGRSGGFDLVIKGPDCFGDMATDGGADLYNRASNTVANALGQAFGALDPLGEGTPLSEGACYGKSPLHPNEDELRAILGD